MSKVLLALLAVPVLAAWTSFCVGVGYQLGKPTTPPATPITTKTLKALMQQDEALTTRMCTIWWFGMTNKERTLLPPKKEAK